MKTNKSRSALTILGIVIGIAAIILIMSLGQGAQKLILSQVQGLGSKSVIVVPGRQLEGPPTTVGLDSLKEKDVQAVENKNNVPYAANVIPLVFGADISSFESQNYRVSIYGSSEKLPIIFDVEPSEGIFFSEDDVKGSSNVVVIGSKTNEKLFLGDSGLGKRIKIKDKTFKVIGILPSKGASSIINFDDGVIIPYTAVQNYISGSKHFDRILVDVDSEVNIDQTVQDVTDTMRRSHNITNPTKDDFTIVNQKDLANKIGVITTALTYFLAAVAAISLLVGGIGIMNIMLVSVTERTREIGLRKAVGATTRDILMQFLFESVVLTMLGGIIGVIIGTLLSFLIAIIISKVFSFGWEFIFPVGGAILGISVSTIIGLTFGIYPASQAAKKSPIEALRYE
ncbi:MAG: ABC transporter permease [Candidatus Paceibacterota bacterium]